jgi:hypothetical protein
VDVEITGVVCIHDAAVQSAGQLPHIVDPSFTLETFGIVLVFVDFGTGQAGIGIHRGFLLFGFISGGGCAVPYKFRRRFYESIGMSADIFSKTHLPGRHDIFVGLRGAPLQFMIIGGNAAVEKVAGQVISNVPGPVTEEITVFTESAPAVLIPDELAVKCGSNGPIAGRPALAATIPKRAENLHTADGIAAHQYLARYSHRCNFSNVPSSH